MNHPGFIQIHFLTSYPSSLLNRDDVGFAKRVPFGGAVRTRISSQCLKRHWRRFDGEGALRELETDKVKMSVRSRQTLRRYVYQPLIDDHINEPLAAAVTAKLADEMLGKSAGRQKKQEAEADAEAAESASLDTAQVTVLGCPELDFLVSEAHSICEAVGDSNGLSDKALKKAVDDAAKKHLTKERRENLRTLRLGAGLDALLFGRMVTSDNLARCDAALHVSHAFTVHAEATESDYFSAVDDLVAEVGELGSGHIGSVELTSGLFYGYIVAALPLLISNLADDRELASQVMNRLVHIIATVSPGAKLGSTAPYSYAHLVLVECATAQPRTLANAFLKPVDARGDLLANAYRAIADHLAELDGAFGRTNRRVLAIGPKQELAAALPDEEFVGSLVELADWTESCVKGAKP